MRTLLIKAIDIYRLCLSPYFGWGCRFEPSCSHYAREAVQRHGAARGTWYTLTRLLRCHPLCPGGFDPVP